MVFIIASSLYSFYFKKNYDFIVETQCDPEVEICFFRDCVGSPDTCPPNGLSYYNEYTIKARDFGVCLDEDCTLACKTGAINCVKTECTETDIESQTCVYYPDGNLEEENTESAN